MKILQINSHYNHGGAGKIVACLHNALLNKGYESAVIFGRDGTSQVNGVYRVGSTMSNRLDALITRTVGLNGFQSRGAARQAISIIDREKPDLLHLHGLHGYYINYTLLFNYINIRRSPVVWTFHDCLAFTGKCGYPYECERFLSGCGACPRLKDYPATYGLDLTAWMWKKKRALFTQTDNKIIISPSEWMTGLAKKSFFGKYPCATIRNGIDTKRIFHIRDPYAARAKHGIRPDAKVALAIASGLEDPRKGVDFILKAAQDMQDVSFVLIGWNADDSALNGLKNVYKAPFIANQDELAEYYASADVFLLPSRAENYATTALESIACGTPVVGFCVGGVPERANGICGTTVPAFDQRAFEVAIRGYLDTPYNMDKRLVLSGIIQRENAIRVMTDQYINVYKELI